MPVEKYIGTTVTEAAAGPRTHTLGCSGMKTAVTRSNVCIQLWELLDSNTETLMARLGSTVAWFAFGLDAAGASRNRKIRVTRRKIDRIEMGVEGQEYSLTLNSELGCC